MYCSDAIDLDMSLADDDLRSLIFTASENQYNSPIETVPLDITVAGRSRTEALADGLSLDISGPRRHLCICAF